MKGSWTLLKLGELCQFNAMLARKREAGYSLVDWAETLEAAGEKKRELMRIQRGGDKEEPQ